ncbi:hypothetical protein [Salininema proteolyticum]|uniref:Uncharacterized protein n=1 Tax=Salininema proteolyticum TaxID=1607685 RepID=A0ABV8TV16_9ACTN
MGRTYTPEEIRNIGEGPLPSIAESYDELASMVNAARVSAINMFDDGLPVKHEVGVIFVSLWEKFETAAREQPVGLRAMGKTFVEVADRYDEDEQDIALNLEKELENIEEVTEDNREEVMSENPPEEKNRVMPSDMRL